MSNLSDTNTHVTDLIGIFRTGTTRPTDIDTAGLKAGDVYINTTDKKLCVYSGSQWVEYALTTTSTSSSTSTSTTTTT